MADTAVNITAGSGTAIDTRTEGTNGNHRQVVVVGDPNTNAGVAPVDGTNGLAVYNVQALTVASHAVTNAGTFATQESGAALTALQLLDDNITAQGTALGSTKTGLAGASVTTSAPTYTTGQISPLSMDTSGALRVTGAGGGTQYTEDAAAASDPVGNMLMAVRRDTLSTSEVSADGDNIALKASNKGKLHVAAELRLGDTVADTGSGTGGSATQRVIMDSSQLATLQTSQGAFAAGTQQVSFPSDHPAIPVTPAGNVAHDATDSGNPVKQGAKATTALSGLTLVANNDRTDLFAGVDGVQIVRPHCNLEDLISGVLANTDGASTAVIAALGSGIKAYITTVIFANTSATAVTVDLRDGTAGSVKATFPVPANTSGLVCNLPVPLGFSANTAVAMDGSAAATTVTCTLIGFKSKV